MKAEMQNLSNVNADIDAQAGIIAEAILEFGENSKILEGSGDCSCIANETCCGCIVQ